MLTLKAWAAIRSFSGNKSALKEFFLKFLKILCIIYKQDKERHLQQNKINKYCHYDIVLRCLGGIFMNSSYWDSFDCEIQCEELDFLKWLIEETFIISAFDSE